MPLEDIKESDLSDGEPAATAPKAKPGPKSKPKAEPKSKPKAEPKKQLPMKAKAGAKPKAEPTPPTSSLESPQNVSYESMEEAVAKAMKRPAAKPSSVSEGGPLFKKPASAKSNKGPPPGRAYKYCYYADKKYGIKRDGHELLTVGILEVSLSMFQLAWVCNFIQVRLEPGLTMDEICDIAVPRSQSLLDFQLPLKFYSFCNCLLS